MGTHQLGIWGEFTTTLQGDGGDSDKKQRKWKRRKEDQGELCKVQLKPLFAFTIQSSEHAAQ